MWTDVDHSGLMWTRISLMSTTVRNRPESTSPHKAHLDTRSGNIVEETMLSRSENNGIDALSNAEKKIYSVGISTGGVAEIRMVMNHAERSVTATTIDLEGAEFAKHCIKESGFSDQIEVKIEDVAQHLPYSNEHFDYIYARLVLHYLPRTALLSSVAELHRILRTEGKIFVVVRSTDCPEVCEPNATFDAETSLTTYSSGGGTYSRYFHTEESIQRYLISAGFSIKHIDTYPEQLCVDFQRTRPADQVDSLIEVLAIKE